MRKCCQFLRPHVPRLVALGIIVALYTMARLPDLSYAERAELAVPFKFARHTLPDFSEGSTRTVRPVHPSLERISAWISSVGAAVALDDLDGDGLPNDVVYVDTRTDRVIVSPVPGTPSRYEPFGLDPAPLRYDPSTMAPMGCLPERLERGWAHGPARLLLGTAADRVPPSGRGGLGPVQPHGRQLSCAGRSLRRAADGLPMRPRWPTWTATGTPT